VQRAAFTTKKGISISPGWLNNVMKSVGSVAIDSIKEIAPNITKTAEFGADATKNLLNSIQGSRNKTSLISNKLSNNRIYGFATKAFNNAMKDLKSGNFNNTERMFEDSDSDGGTLSFGDDGESIDIKMEGDSKSADAILKLSDNIQRSAVSNAKMQKASMDAYLALQSTSMNQISEIGTGIINQLNNVNNNLAALVNYQNENMSKFIEASIAYYNEVGKSKKSSEENVSGADVLNNRNGGIDLDNYKKYVKQQLSNNPYAGMLKMVLDDRDMMNQLASNPLGFAASAITKTMMPKIVVETVGAMEKAYSNFLPNMLVKMSEWVNDDDSGVFGSIKRFIGHTFGLKVDNKRTLDAAKINRDAIRFDGETKHAITEIITKELREQTGYLSIIAKHYDNNADSIVKNGGEYWSYLKNGYVKRDDITKSIVEEMTDAISGIFNDSDFGESLNNFVKTVDSNRNDSDKVIEEYRNTIAELTHLITRSDRSIDLPVIEDLVRKTGASDSTKEALSDYIKGMYTNNRLAFDNANVTRIRSRSALNSVDKEINEDNVKYNLRYSKFMENDSNGKRRERNDVIDEAMGWGKYAQNRMNTSGAYVQTTDYNQGGNGGSGSNIDFNRFLENIRTYGNNTLNNLRQSGSSIWQAFTSNDSNGIVKGFVGFYISQVKNLFGRAKNILFGERDQDGNFQKGLLTDFVTRTKEKLINIGSTIRDGVMIKLFGLKRDPETGKYVKDEDNVGLMSHAFSFLKEGVNGWMSSIFGTDSEEERSNIKNKAMDYLKEALPNAAIGAIAGIGLQHLAGDSLLGTFIANPIIGIGISSAIGFASKNENFQKYLFGEKDENGERMGGLISKRTQDFFKNNKELVAGSMAIGAGVGYIKGAGILGSIVGGPIAGALLGLAGAVAFKSGVITDFIFGNSEKGTKGVLTRMKEAWRTNFKNSDETDLMNQGLKALSMSAIGTGAGGLIGTLMGGPLLGAITGSILSITSQGKNLKEFLFGTKDGLDIGNGKRADKKGLFGVMLGTIHTNIIAPMATEFRYIADDFQNVIKHKLLAPFGFLGEYVSGKLGKAVNSILLGANNILGGIGGAIKDAAKEAFSPVTKLFGNIASKGTDAMYKIFRNSVMLPGRFVVAFLKTMGLKEKWQRSPVGRFFKALGHDVKHLILSSIKGFFRSIFTLAAAPFRAIGFGASVVAGGAKWIGSKVGGIKTSDGRTLSQRFHDRFDDSLERFKQHLAETGDDSLFSRIKLNDKEYKARKYRIEQQKKANQRHDKNAKILSKYSKGQFTTDSDDARTWLKYHRPEIYEKYFGGSANKSNTSLDTERRSEHGASIDGMSGEDIINANPNSLDAQGKQTQAILKIEDAVIGIYKYMQDEAPMNSDQLKQKAEEEYRKQQEDKDFIKGLSKSEKLEWLKSKGLANYDDDTSDAELGDVVARELQSERGIIPNAPGKHSRLKYKLSASSEKLKDSIKNAGRSSSLLKLIMGKDKPTGWSMVENSDYDETAQDVDDIADETNEDVGHHFIGGIIKSGLSLVGEKGAELIKAGANGVKVLSNKATKRAVNAVRSRRKRTLSEAVDDYSSDNTNIADELEEASDEKLSSNLATIRMLRGWSNDPSLQAKENAARLAIAEDAKRDRFAAALKGSRTAEEIRKDAEERKYREDTLANQQATIDGIKEGNDNQKKFSDSWSSIFSPSGLLTGALLLGGGWLLKNFPKLMGGLFKVAKSIGKILWRGIKGIFNFGGKVLGHMLKDVYNTEENAERTNGNDMDEELSYQIDEATKGHIFTDGKGRIKATSAPVAKYLTKKVGKPVINHLSKTIGKKAMQELHYKTASEAIEKGLIKKGSNIVSKKAFKAGQKIYNKHLNKKATKILTRELNKFANEGSEKGITKIISSGSKLVKDMITKFLNFVKDKFIKKTGKKISTVIFKKCSADAILPKLLKVGASKLSAFFTKLTVFVTGKAAVAASTVGIGEAVGVALGAIDGLTGTAKLFHVSPDDVDWKMRTISTILGGFAGSTVGGALELIDAFVSEIIGFSFFKSVAYALYDVWADKDSVEALSAAQKSWNDQYNEERDDTLKAQFETQKKMGVLNKDMTFDKFKQGVINGDKGFHATYQSEDDWNADKNKSMFDHVISGIGAVGGGIANGFKGVGNFFFGGREHFYDDNGLRYNENGDGSYSVYDKNNNLLNDSISKEVVDTAKLKSKKELGLFGEIGKGISNFFGFGEDENKENEDAFVDKATNMTNTAIQSATNSIEEMNNGKNFAGTTTDVWYEATGSYYKRNSDGTFNRYSPNNDLINKNISFSTVQGLISTGFLVKGTVKSSNKIMDKSIVEKVIDKGKSLFTTVKNFISDLFSTNNKTITTTPTGGSGRGMGGFGDADIYNGAAYFSQNDGRWGGKSYSSGFDNSNMSLAGCGPTAMAMATNTANMRNSVTPMDMAKIAQATGNRDETGTNSNFINDSAAMMGMPSEQVIKPTSGDIDYQLSQGKPVVLLGNTTGSSNTPYTDAGHYVVAVGKDSNGRVLVNDPRGKSYSKSFDLDSLTSGTLSSWGIGYGGYGPPAPRKHVFKQKGVFKHRGAKRFKETHPENEHEKWMNIVKAVKAAIAASGVKYSQSDYVTITVGGENFKVRQDCSGYVCACLQAFGVLPKSTYLNTGVMDPSSNVMQKTGFTYISFPGWENLIEGDILWKRGHTEIFSHNDGGRQFVYNVGDDTSAANPGPTGSGGSYTGIWRHGISGTSALSSFGVTDANGNVISGGASFDMGSGGIFSMIGSELSKIFDDFQREMFGLPPEETSNSDGATFQQGDDSVAAPTTRMSKAKKGDVVNPPNGYGAYNTFMGWQKITSPTSNQYKLRKAAGQNFDANGYGMINGRYVVATTSTYGDVGDYIDVQYADGRTVKAIIGDIKSFKDANANVYGHDRNVIEFIVDQDRWYRSDKGVMAGHEIKNTTNPGSIKGQITSVTNMGSYYDDRTGGKGLGKKNKVSRASLKRSVVKAFGGRGDYDDGDYSASYDYYSQYYDEDLDSYRPLPSYGSDSPVIERSSSTITPVSSSINTSPQYVNYQSDSGFNDEVIRLLKALVDNTGASNKIFERIGTLSETIAENSAGIKNINILNSHSTPQQQNKTLYTPDMNKRKFAQIIAKGGM